MLEVVPATAALMMVGLLHKIDDSWTRAMRPDPGRCSTRTRADGCGHRRSGRPPGARRRGRPAEPRRVSSVTPGWSPSISTSTSECGSTAPSAAAGRRLRRPRAGAARQYRCSGWANPASGLRRLGDGAAAFRDGQPSGRGAHEDHGVLAYRKQACRHRYRALRRRRQRTRLTWTRMGRLTDQWIPVARVTHPWPDARFAARTQGRSPVR